MRIFSIILISSLFLLSCGKEKTLPLPEPITPVATGVVIDLSAPSVSGEIRTQTGK